MTDHYHIIKDWTDQVPPLPFVHLPGHPFYLRLHSPDNTQDLSNERADIDFNLNAILWNPLMDTTSIQNNINQ